MDNTRIMSGYNVEFQASAAFFKNLLQKTVTEFLPVYKDKLKNPLIVTFLPMISAMNVDKTSLSEDADKNPLIRIAASLSTLKVNLQLVLKRVYGNPSKQLTVSLILENDIDILGFKYKAQTLIKDYDVKIPDNLLGYVSGQFKIKYIQGNSEYEDVIAIMSNLKLDGASVSPEGDVDKAVSFLPKGKEYVLGFNNNTYDMFLQIIDPKIRKQVNDENSRAHVNNVYFDISDQTITIVTKGKYDAKRVIDSLDPRFTIKTKMSFSIQNESVNVDCSSSSEIDKNILYSILGAIAGLFVFSVFGAIIGLHANSFIKIGTKDLCSDMADDFNEGFSAPENYGYHNPNGKGNVGVARMHRRDKLVTHLNCLPNEPIPLFRYSSGSLLYDYNYAIQLKYSDIAVNQNGFAVAGSLNSISPWATCNNVVLKEMRYAGDNLLSLVYENEQGDTETVAKSKAYEYLKESERLSYFRIDHSADGPVRDAHGKIPMTMLPKPVATKKKNGKIYEYEFSTGLVGKAKDLIELYEAHLIYIYDVTLVHRESGNYFRTKKDDTTDNNLDTLPKIEED